jgi:cytochrome c
MLLNGRMGDVKTSGMMCAVAGLIALGAVFGMPAASRGKAAPPGDAAAGKLVFARCAICHTVTAGQNKIGPSLAGVVGRKAGSVPDFNYSPAMKGANLTWTAEELDAYLSNPRGKVPGNKMIFAGLPKPADRANVIAYLANPQ